MYILIAVIFAAYNLVSIGFKIGLFVKFPSNLGVVIHVENCFIG